MDVVLTLMLRNCSLTGMPLGRCSFSNLPDSRENVLINVAAHHIVRHVNRVREPQCISAAMALDSHAVQAQQNRAVVFPGIKFLAQGLDRRGVV